MLAPLYDVDSRNLDEYGSTAATCTHSRLDQEGGELTRVREGGRHSSHDISTLNARTHRLLGRREEREEEKCG